MIRDSTHKAFCITPDVVNGYSELNLFYNLVSHNKRSSQTKAASTHRIAEFPVMYGDDVQEKAPSRQQPCLGTKAF